MVQHASYSRIIQILIPPAATVFHRVDIVTKLLSQRVLISYRKKLVSLVIDPRYRNGNQTTVARVAGLDEISLELTARHADISIEAVLGKDAFAGNE